MNPISLLWSFQGRIGRGAYIVGFLLNAVFAAIVIGTVVFLSAGRQKYVPGGPPDPVVSFAVVPGFILFTWAQFATAVKRLHDLGKSGWLSLFLLVPLFAVIAVFLLMIFRGEERDNRYGRVNSLASRLST